MACRLPDPLSHWTWLLLSSASLMAARHSAVPVPTVSLLSEQHLDALEGFVAYATEDLKAGLLLNHWLFQCWASCTRTLQQGRPEDGRLLWAVPQGPPTTLQNLGCPPSVRLLTAARLQVFVACWRAVCNRQAAVRLEGSSYPASSFVS